MGKKNAGKKRRVKKGGKTFFCFNFFHFWIFILDESRSLPEIPEVGEGWNGWESVGMGGNGWESGGIGGTNSGEMI